MKRKINDEVTYWLDGDKDAEYTGIILGENFEGTFIISTGIDDGWEVSENENLNEGYNVDEKHFGIGCWYVSESEIQTPMTQ